MSTNPLFGASLTSSTAAAAAAAAALLSATSTTTTTTTTTTTMLPKQSAADRQEFLVFVKVLFKYLEKMQLSLLKRHCKAVVADCTRRNRREQDSSDAAATTTTTTATITATFSLSCEIKVRLRHAVGEIHWARVQRCYEMLCAKRLSSQVASVLQQQQQQQFQRNAAILRHL